MTEREYKCLGQWMENGFIYTYTQRIDVGTYECFVGAQHIDNRIFIKEAGEHCQRNIDPNKFGMELQNTRFCDINKAPYDSDLRETNKLDKYMIPNYPYSEHAWNSTNIVPKQQESSSTEHRSANDLSVTQSDRVENSLNTSWHAQNAVPKRPIQDHTMPSHTTTKPTGNVHHNNEDNNIRVTSTSRSYVEYEVNHSWMLQMHPVLFIISAITFVVWV